MRVLITGGSGFIGTNLVEHFNVRGDAIDFVTRDAAQVQVCFEAVRERVAK